eukprot:3658933-Rhodomonas_salina.2
MKVRSAACATVGSTRIDKKNDSASLTALALAVTRILNGTMPTQALNGPRPIASRTDISQAYQDGRLAADQ